VELPEDSYHGAEIIDVAKKIKEEYGDKYLNKKEMDKETKTFFNDFSLKYMLNIIKQDLKTFGVEMDI
jgi:arginyl-tRNA synthetase